MARHATRTAILSTAALVLLSMAAAAAAAAPPQQPEDPAHTQFLAAQRGDCLALFDGRRRLTQEEQQRVAAQLPGGEDSSSPFCPAILWTYTGTGNTMTRMLIEVASGWHTGSVYTDLSLLGILPGEAACDGSTIAVKAHPQWHSFASLGADGFRPDTPAVPPDAKEVCPCAFNRAVAVIRDPYATFLAEYKRLRTHDYDACSHAAVEGKPCQGGHVSVLSRDTFNATDFRTEVLRMAREYADMFDSYDSFKAKFPAGFHLTTFEALTRPDTKVAALADLLAALGVPPHGDTGCAAESAGSDGAAAASETCSASALHGYDSNRLACAFEMADHPAIHRPKDPAGIDAAAVYGGSDGCLVCDIWRVVGARAAAHGYAPWGGISCPAAT